MTENTLYFIFGLAVALLVLLFVAPAVRRRDSAQIHRRVTASMPMSLSEIEAGKDALRSEFAVTARKMELAAEAQRDSSVAQALDIEKGRAEAARLSASLAETEARLAEAHTREEDLRADLRTRGEQVSDLGAALAEKEKSLTAKASQLAELGKRHEDVSLEAGERKVKASALAEEIAAKDRQLSDANIRALGAEAELTAERAAFEAERLATEADRSKLADRERTIAGLKADLADRGARLKQHARDAADLQDRLAKSLAVERDLAAQIAEAHEGKSLLEASVASLISEHEKQFADERAAREAERQTAQADRAKLADHERAIEHMQADLDHRDGRLDVHAREKADLQDRLAKSQAVERDLAAQIAEAREGKSQLEAKVADLTSENQRLVTAAESGERQNAQLAADRLRLEGELARTQDETAALKAELERTRVAEASAPKPDETGAGLRQQIQDLAAQVIRMAALAEGPGGAVARALKQPGGQGVSVVSLADRVRQLQAADEQKRRSSDL